MATCCQRGERLERVQGWRLQVASTRRAGECSSRGRVLGGLEGKEWK